MKICFLLDQVTFDNGVCKMSAAMSMCQWVERFHGILWPSMWIMQSWSILWFPYMTTDQKHSYIMILNSLTHCSLVMPYGVRELGQHWTLILVMAWCLMAPIHYLQQCWLIKNQITSNIFQYNFYQNSNIFIQRNAIENVTWQISTILMRSQCVVLK